MWPTDSYNDFDVKIEKPKKKQQKIVKEQKKRSVHPQEHHKMQLKVFKHLWSIFNYLCTINPGQTNIYYIFINVLLT